jgi:hypothetical protein
MQTSWQLIGAALNASPELLIGGMNMDQIGKLLDRPRLYFNIDGLGELGGGVLCLGFALVLSLMMRWPAHSFWHQISLFAFFGLALLIRYGTKAVKTRITYPRTGFVEYRRGDRRRNSIIAAVLGALIVLGLWVAVRRHWDITTPASLTGLVFGLVFAAAYGYHFVRAVRWKWVIVGAIAVASLVIAFLPADVLRALGSELPVVLPDRAKPLGILLLNLVAYGTILSISGGISLWLYLRHTHFPAQEGQ